MNLIRKIFSPTCFIVSILILIYTFYRSEITNNGDNFGYYKSYYIISSILVLFSLLSFFLNKIIKDYLIILSISFLITLYLFETFLYKKELLENREKIYFNQTGKVLILDQSLVFMKI